MEKPNPSLHHLLLSTTSRLGGEYESADISISMAWPNMFGQDGAPPLLDLQASPYSRNFFVVTLNVEEQSEVKKQPRPIPNYSDYGTRILRYYEHP